MIFLISLFGLSNNILNDERNSEYQFNLPQTNEVDPNLNRFFSFSSSDIPQRIEVDDEGYIYISGQTASSDFYTTEDAYDTTYNGNTDVFVMKLSPDGEDLLFSTFIGGSNIDRGYRLTIADDGSIIIFGYTYSSNYPTTEGAFDESYGGNIDCFITKLSNDGSALIYSTYIGGSQGDYIGNVRVDEFGYIYVSGNTWSSDFPTTFDAYDSSYGGSGDGFFTILNPDGASLNYSTIIGTTAVDKMDDLYLFNSSTILLSGFTESTVFPTTSNAFQETYGGNRDGTIVLFNYRTNVLEYSSYFGGMGEENARIPIFMDDEGDIYLVGSTTSSNLPTTEDAFQSNNRGEGDIFVAKFSNSLENLLYCTYFGGSEDDSATFARLQFQNQINFGIKSESSDFYLSELIPVSEGITSGISMIFNVYSNEIYNFKYYTNENLGSYSCIRDFYSSNETHYIIGETDHSYMNISSYQCDNIHNGEEDAFLVIFDEKIYPETPVLNEIATPDEDGEFTLSWSSNIYSNYYDLYRSDEDIEDVSEMSPIYSGAENSYQETDLTNGTYYYAVVAVNGSGESKLSNVISVRVEIEEVVDIIAPILNSIESPDEDGTFIVTWGSVEGATDYKLYRSSNNSIDIETLTPIYTGTDTHFQETDLPNGMYYYFVVAVFDSADSDISNIVIVEVKSDSIPGFSAWNILFPLSLILLMTKLNHKIIRKQ